jgi:inosose dehydratase
MNLGYMTNAFGLLVGSGGGVTSMKDIQYVTLGEDEEAVKAITDCGFNGIELFDGNLMRYAHEPEKFSKMLSKYQASLLGVYVGGHFIYQDALPDELYRIEQVAVMAAKLGARHLVVGGGAIRASGIRETDYHLLASALNQVQAIARRHGLIASYHPHLGSMVQHPDEIDKIFELTPINFCPDIAHLVAGGGDALEIIKKYYSRIQYVHLKDLSAAGFVPLGAGKIDLAAIISFLQGQGYVGDYLVEIDGYAGDPVEACEASMAFLKGKIC